jgi:hypothetical protein
VFRTVDPGSKTGLLKELIRYRSVSMTEMSVTVEGKGMKARRTKRPFDADLNNNKRQNPLAFRVSRFKLCRTPLSER